MELKHLTIDKLNESTEITTWLEQFSTGDVNTAKSLLCQLKFISRDEYSKWLLDKLSKSYKHETPYAIYAVRKFRESPESIWDNSGNLEKRPPQTLGSEDLVASIISTAIKNHKNSFLDHPSLNDLRAKKVRNILLIDDSIGSGKRVSNYIKLMFSNKTLLSWWSRGLFKLHIISYARTHQSENVILDTTPGSDHGKRKFRVSEKLFFDSELVYDNLDRKKRWGSSYEDIISLCKRYTQIKKDRRFGFGDVMGNLVFYHSVPNNIPGILYAKSKNWVPLFQNRSLNQNLVSIIDKANTKSGIKNVYTPTTKIPEDLLFLLNLIKKGIRNKKSISRRMEYDINLVNYFIEKAKNLGLLTDPLLLSKAGQDLIHKNLQKKYFYYKLNYELYLPESWCADQKTVQPSDIIQTDSIGLKSMDGDDRLSSLEKTEEMATEQMSLIMNVPKGPSKARNRHILYDPAAAGPKQKWMEDWSAHHLYRSAIRNFDDIKSKDLHKYAINLRNNGLPVIFSLKHLSNITSIDYKFLVETVKRRRESSNYNFFVINKKNGGKRFIHSANGKLFKILKYINNQILQKTRPHNSSFAYHKNGGIKNCASMHCGCNWIFQFDLKDFFYTISEHKVYKVFQSIGYKSLLSFELTRLCTTLRLPKHKNNYIKESKSESYKKSYYRSPYSRDKWVGVLPQGSPTSPMLSNLAAFKLDCALYNYAINNGFVYTRYADDLIFSAFELPRNTSIGKIKWNITSLIRENGFTENKRKIRIAGPGSRKVVLGLLVDGEKPRINKQLLKKVDRYLYSINKFSLEKVAKHDGFRSPFGLLNHLSGLIAYINDVDNTRLEALNSRFLEIYNKYN